MKDFKRTTVAILISALLEMTIATRAESADSAPSGASSAPQRETAKALWQADLGNGFYQNPILYADYSDPDFGIYMIQSEDPKSGAWSDPLLILAGKGLIDPTPLWDDDGQAWLLHAWAKSRSGKNNILTLHKMSLDGTRVEEAGKVIIDGHKIPGYRTLEGPKFYQRNGYYYIFAPAGGVPVGWQAVFRSRSIQGPYEARTVLEQGDTLINGPHQGAWVQTPTGEDWFFHFQSSLAYGRIVHLQPMRWVDDWPVIGSDPDGDGVGNPVRTFRKPDLAVNQAAASPPSSDEFDRDSLGVQWQWNANYREEWYSLTKRQGYLRLYAQPSPDPESNNHWMLPSLLLQKIPAPNFIAEITLEIPEGARNLRTGLVMFGEDYAWIGVQTDPESGELQLGYVSCREARIGCTESFEVEKPLTSNTLTVRMTLMDGGGTVFSYQYDTGRCN